MNSVNKNLCLAKSLQPSAMLYYMTKIKPLGIKCKTKITWKLIRQHKISKSILTVVIKPQAFINRGLGIYKAYQLKYCKYAYCRCGKAKFTKQQVQSFVCCRHERTGHPSHGLLYYQQTGITVLTKVEKKQGTKQAHI